MKFLLKLFVICAIVLSFNCNIVLAEDVDLDAGESIFTANCAACHAGGNNVIAAEKTLQIEVLHDNGMDSIDAIMTQVKNGKSSMPAFGDRLVSEEVVNVANFILNQATTHNW
uniref:Cytochrome c-553 n=1 Tax=Sphondylothamnion multifidum TaxID=193186 RepID=A0A4D6WYP3_9FLOR|nr:cytochrome c553 [Sphondylothamnion multifidum]